MPTPLTTTGLPSVHAPTSITPSTVRGQLPLADRSHVRAWIAAFMRGEAGRLTLIFVLFGAALVVGLIAESQTRLYNPRPEDGAAGLEQEALRRRQAAGHRSTPSIAYRNVLERLKRLSPKTRPMCGNGLEGGSFGRCVRRVQRPKLSDSTTVRSLLRLRINRRSEPCRRTRSDRSDSSSIYMKTFTCVRVRYI